MQNAVIPFRYYISEHSFLIILLWRGALQRTLRYYDHADRDDYEKNSIVDNEEGRKRNLILIFILQKEEEENDDKTKILNPSHPKQFRNDVIIMNIIVILELTSYASSSILLLFSKHHPVHMYMHSSRQLCLVHCNKVSSRKLKLLDRNMEMWKDIVNTLLIAPKPLKTYDKRQVQQKLQ